MSRPSRGALVNGGITGIVVLLIVGLLLFQTGLLPVTADSHEERELAVTDCSGNTKATVTADVASSFSQQYVGLSRTSSLPAESGMLFPASSEQQITIEMRNMNYDLDVVYIGADGRINSIEQGSAPTNPAEYYLTYDTVSGQGQYVLEVNDGWASTNNVTAGDCVEGVDGTGR